MVRKNQISISALLISGILFSSLSPAAKEYRRILAQEAAAAAATPAPAGRAVTPPVPPATPPSGPTSLRELKADTDTAHEGVLRTGDGKNAIVIVKPTGTGSGNVSGIEGDDIGITTAWSLICGKNATTGKLETHFFNSGSHVATVQGDLFRLGVKPAYQMPLGGYTSLVVTKVQQDSSLAPSGKFSAVIDGFLITVNNSQAAKKTINGFNGRTTIINKIEKLPATKTGSSKLLIGLTVNYDADMDRTFIIFDDSKYVLIGESTNKGNTFNIK